MTIHDQASAARATRRSTRRPARTDGGQYLLATDETGIAELEAALATLPLCAKGRVFVEVESAADVGVLDVPTRMTVTWLTRSDRSGAPGSGERCTRGVALGRAVRAWSDEMLCDPQTRSHIWLGGDYRSVSGCFEHLTGELAIDPEQIVVPEEYRLRS